MTAQRLLVLALKVCRAFWGLLGPFGRSTVSFVARLCKRSFSTSSSVPEVPCYYVRLSICRHKAAFVRSIYLHQYCAIMWSLDHMGNQVTCGWIAKFRVDKVDYQSSTQ